MLLLGLYGFPSVCLFIFLLCLVAMVFQVVARVLLLCYCGLYGVPALGCYGFPIVFLCC